MSSKEEAVDSFSPGDVVECDNGRIGRVEQIWDDQYKKRYLKIQHYFTMKEVRDNMGKPRSKDVRELYVTRRQFDWPIGQIKRRVCVRMGENSAKGDEFFVRFHFTLSTLKFKKFEATKIVPAESARKQRTSHRKPSTPRQSTPRPSARKPKRPRAASRSVFAEACQRLQLSAVPEVLPCRERERTQVKSFLQGAIRDGESGSGMYISGMPGTGKTATVSQVIRELRRKTEANKLPEFDFVEINAMKLPTPHHAYTQLWKSLTEKHATWKRAVQLLEQRFSKPNARRKCCVVLLDELDYLVTKKETVIYNFFDWPTRKHSKLIVIGIANTMDLPERLMPRVHSRLGLERITFKAYNYNQLKKIIHARLSELPAFQGEAIEMCARNVASVSGDVRRALQICRRAAEICEEKGRKSQKVGNSGDFMGRMDFDESKEDSEHQVTYRDIQEAVKSLYKTASVGFLRDLRIYEKLFLCSLILRLKQLHLSESDLDGLRPRFNTLCSNQNLTPLSVLEVVQLAKGLFDVRLILMKVQSGVQYNPILRLNVQEDDVEIAFEKDKICSKLLRG
eukprot:58670_1